MTKINECFEVVREAAGMADARCKGFKLLVGCPVADEDHRKAKRQYMHVEHVANTVCCSKAASKLDRRHLVGLFMHEFGHIIGGPAQWQADLAAFSVFKLPIMYDKAGVQFVRLP